MSSTHTTKYFNTPVVLHPFCMVFRTFCWTHTRIGLMISAALAGRNVRLPAHGLLFRKSDTPADRVLRMYRHCLDLRYVTSFVLQRRVAGWFNLKGCLTLH